MTQVEATDYFCYFSFSNLPFELMCFYIEFSTTIY